MTKLEFMKELESLLSDIPLEEREEALQYYNGYFEDAGEEHEQEIIEELGSPEKVAAIIKEALNSTDAENVNKGYFTEKGYQNSIDRDTRFELERSHKRSSENNKDDNENTAKSTSNNYQTNQANQTNSSNYYDKNNYTNGAYQTNGSATGNGNNTYQSNQGQNGSNNYRGKPVNNNDNIAKIILLIIVCVVGSPVIISLFGVFIGIVTSIIGVIIGLGVAGVAMILCGIIIFIAGLVKLTVPLIGMLLCGSGLVVFGIGMLFTLACIVLCKNVLPAFVKWVLNVCRRPFQNRSVTA